MSAGDVHNEENHAEALAEQLAQANAKIARMSEELDGLEVEQKLTHKLAAAGAIDLEAAVLVARSRVEGQTDAELDRCVTQLRKDKGFLFAGSSPVAVPRRTAAVKDRVTQSVTALEQAARRAAKTGSRADLLRYLSLRRNAM